MLRDVAVLVELQEDVLGDLGLLGRGGAAELVEGDAEPLVDVAVDGMEAVAELPRGDAFLEGLGLGGGAVFVRAADIEGLVARQAGSSAQTRRRRAPG